VRLARNNIVSWRIIVLPVICHQGRLPLPRIIKQMQNQAFANSESVLNYTLLITCKGSFKLLVSHHSERAKTVFITRCTRSRTTLTMEADVPPIGKEHSPTPPSLGPNSLQADEQPTDETATNVSMAPSCKETIRMAHHCVIPPDFYSPRAVFGIASRRTLLGMLRCPVEQAMLWPGAIREF
jgi:hypothetical protein